MKPNAPTTKLKFSALAIALTCTLYGPSYAFAQEQLQSHASPALNTDLSVSDRGASTAATGNEPVRRQHASFAVAAAVQIEKDAANASANASSATTNTTAAGTGMSSNAEAQANLDPITKAQRQRLQDVTDFATTVHETMVNNVTTNLYLSNRQLASSSTFPLRLLTRLRDNPWRPAPFMPVPEKDLSCYYGIPAYREPQEYDPNQTPVQITADEVTGSIENNISYKGNVVVIQGDQTFSADEASYNRATGEVSSSGNITYEGPQLTITSRQSIVSNLNTQVSEFFGPNFQLNGSVASGKSDKITIDKEKKVSNIENLAFTTCPAGDNSWHLESDEVVLEQGESYGEAYGNVLYIKDVPVFYLPYVNFPISNKRKSGLLYPSFAISSDNGFEYEQPIYFNIAPNYDYTLSPRIMTKRGLLLKNEFRYLPWEDTQGIIELDYIPKDNNWELEHSGDDERYMLHWQHASYFFNRDLSVIVDYQQVRNNDYDYINDIGADGVEVTDDHLKQSLLATYDRSKYNFSIEARDYQRLLPDDLIYSRPFAILPQIKAQYYDTYGPLTFDVQGEMTRFSSSSDSIADRFEATRVHIEPDIGYQIFNNRGTSVSANVRGFLTYYNQDELDKMPAYYSQNLGFTKLEDTTRSLYMLQLKGKTTLERKVLDLRHTQTLEPEVQYQFIPYEDQSNIALYDSTDRMNDYYSNFSFRRFTGYDRIPDLNRVSIGLSSRLLDAHDRELLRVGVSQSYSFVPTRVTLNPNDPDDLYPRSPLSAFINMQPMPGLTLHASASYSTEDNELTSWNAMTQYRNENGLLLQVSYRFTDQGNRSLSNNIIDLKQVGFVAEVPLSDHFSATVASYHDIEQQENIDSKLAIKYEECCWSLAFVYESYNSCDWDSLTREKDHRVGIQFEFKGVGAFNVAGSSDRNFTDTRLLNYFDPTNLSQ